MVYATLSEAWGDSYTNYNTSSEDASIAIQNPYKDRATQQALLRRNAKQLSGSEGGYLPLKDADLVEALKQKYDSEGPAGVLAVLPGEMRAPTRSPPKERTPGAWEAGPAVKPPAAPEQDPILLGFAVLAIVLLIAFDEDS